MYNCITLHYTWNIVNQLQYKILKRYIDNWVNYFLQVYNKDLKWLSEQINSFYPKTFQVEIKIEFP